VPVGPFGIDPAIWAPLRLIIAVLLVVGLVYAWKKKALNWY